MLFELPNIKKQMQSAGKDSSQKCKLTKNVNNILLINFTV